MFLCRRSGAGSFCPPALLSEKQRSPVKRRKNTEKVVRFAEKQYLCGRKAVIAFALGPRHQLLDEEVPLGGLARRQVRVEECVCGCPLPFRFRRRTEIGKREEPLPVSESWIPF